MNPNNISVDVAESLKKRYDVHPLIFHRSCEHSGSLGELFDILDTMPKEYPIAWDNSKRSWVVVGDLIKIKDIGEK